MWPGPPLQRCALSLRPMLKALYAMKIKCLILSGLLLAGCGKPMNIYDNRLQGTWISNKERTLAAIDESKVEPEMLSFLKENLGDLGFIYEGARTAVIFTKNPDIEPEFKEYKTVDVLENSVVIVPPEGEEITLTYEGNCYFVVTRSNYNEYFCRES